MTYKACHKLSLKLSKALRRHMLY